MALKFGDSVILVQKSRGGDGKETVSRVNAIVLASAVQAPDVHRSQALRDHKGNTLAAGEYLDLAFPNLGLALEHTPIPRAVEQIFKLAYSVAPWTPDKWIGWEPISVESQPQSDNWVVQPLRPAAAVSSPVPAKK